MPPACSAAASSSLGQQQQPSNSRPCGSHSSRQAPPHVAVTANQCVKKTKGRKRKVSSIRGYVGDCLLYVGVPRTAVLEAVSNYKYE